MLFNQTVFAQTKAWNPACMVDGVPTLKCLEDVFGNIIFSASTLIILVLFIMFVIGAFTYLTSGGNPERVKKGIAEKACNAILIKPNQIGTVSETMAVTKQARDAGWKVIVSHRSGETNDTFISDFAVGVGADYVKFGAPARGERVAKYNRLLAIESELHSVA